MRYLKYFALVAILAVPALYSQAQVAVGVQIGPSYGLYNPPPVCAYGYYPDYPYNCAPYGYWGPQWFVDGVFIGAGPWYHFYYTHPAYYRPYYRRFYGGTAFVGHGGFEHFRGDEHRFAGGERGFRGGEHYFRDDHGFRGGNRGFGHGGGEFRGGRRGGELHADRGSRGDGGVRGGRR